MKKTTASLDYNFRFDAEAKKVSGDRRRPNSWTDIVVNQMVYEVTMTNASRDTVGPLKVEYVAFLENNADGDYQSASDEREILTKGKLDVDGQLKFNVSATLRTKEIKVEIIDYDYANRDWRDRLAGIMLRIFDADGKQVAEWKSSEVEDRAWPGEGKKSGGSVTIK